VVAAVVHSEELPELVEQVAVVMLEMVVEADKQVEQILAVGVAVLLLQLPCDQAVTAVLA
jgi:hypothetical protein